MQPYLENNHSPIVARGKDIERGVRGQYPEAVILAAERVKAAAVGHVPHPYGLVFGVGQNQILARVKHDTRHVVVVPATRVHFPGLQSTIIPRNRSNS